MMRTPVTEKIDVESISYETLDQRPYPIYSSLREHAPVAYIPAFDEWFVSRWDDCMAVSAMTDDIIPGRDLDDEFFGTPNVLTLDGAEHTAFRLGIDDRLRPRVVNGYMKEVVRPVVIEYIERIRQRCAADLTQELFEPISVRVVGDQLGMADVDDATLIRWFHTLSQSHEIRDGAEGGVLAEIETYLRARIDVLRETPDGSIMSHMLRGGLPEGAPPRTYEDVSASLRVIILGGFQEPGHAVANTFHGLFGRPEQLALVTSEPETYAAPALHEGMRWISPVSGVARTARRDITIGDATIPAGSRITLLLASANHDPDRFADPDTYDLDRMRQPNAAFGYGEHYCSGHFFARSLGHLIVEETARRLTGLRPDPAADAVVSGYGFRAATHLPAVWDA